MNEQVQPPDPPKFSDEQWQRCRESGNYMPILFEWYKFVGHVCVFFALIERQSPAVREMDAVHYAVLTGLLNRCSRLMLSNIALSHEGRFGETTALLDRCIFESCLKAEWLCHKGTGDAFRRYLADGLKTEVELKSEIEGNIASRRDGKALNIEDRMLGSIGRHFAASGLTESEIVSAKKMPSIASILEELGYKRLSYVVQQRIGSHHVHGTWPSLLMHYLEVDANGNIGLRDHNCETHPNQFVAVPLQLIRTVEAYVWFIFERDEDAQSISAFLESIADEIGTVNQEMVGSDFDETQGI